MGNELNPAALHHLHLDDRSKLQVSGVNDVESFDEQTIVVHTAQGVLIVRGEQLHLQMLSLEGGQICVDGTIDALIYEDDSREQGGFFSRLFR